MGGFAFFESPLINGRHAPHELRSLAAAATPLEKIWYVDASDRFQLEQAIIPSMDRFSRTIAPWKIGMLRAWKQNPGKSRSLRLSRRK
jgi:hypothetical protein